MAGCACVLVASCASPDSRIRRNAELFETFPPEVQAAVRDGRVDLGFNQDMVFIALGKPNREYTRRTRQGEFVVWAYTDHFRRVQRQKVDGRFRVRDSRTGHVHSVRDSVWVDVPTFYEFDRLRIEFQDNEVVAIEEFNR